MTVLTGIRPSLWARSCPTAAVYQGRGEPAAEHTPEAKEFFFRGAVFEEIVMRQVAAKHGRHNVQRQVVIPIPGIGEGHADGYLTTEKALIEVKSTTTPHPNSDTFAAGSKQTKIYLAYHPEAELGYLYMLDPNRMRPADIYTIRLSDQDRQEIEAERLYIEAAVAVDMTLPKHGSDWRPCTHPRQAKKRLCPFAATCFDGWEEEPLPEIDDPEALSAAEELNALKMDEQIHNSALKMLEQARKQVQETLAELLPVGKTVVGPYVVTRTQRHTKPKFSVKAFEAAGHSIEPLSEFFQGGGISDVWSVRKSIEPEDGWPF